MRRRKRLFYTPGLISLIGLLITLPSFYRKNIPVKEYCLTLFAPNDRKNPVMFSKYYLQNEIRKKKKIHFTLNENKKDNKKKMEVIRFEALKLKYTQDTSTVVLINLTDSTTYGDYISILDMCVADDHKRYASWGNKFVIFGEWPKKKIEKSDIISPIYCGTKPYVNPEHRPTFIDSLIKKMKNNYSPQGLYLVVWFFVLTISYFVSKRLRRINIAETPNSPSSSTP